MIKPDLLVTFIKHCDYPLFRLFLRRYRDFFGKIIIYFSEHFRHMYYDKFIQDDLSGLGNIQFLQNIEYKYGLEDWRNVSTNYMLQYSGAEWVSSVEQDFFSKDWNSLIEAVKKTSDEADLIGWWQENNKYIHPSFWFIRRELLDKTNKDFSARDGHDHFGWITEDVIKLGGKIKSTQDMGFKDFVDCFHLGGVNQNYLEGLKEGYVFHRPDWFYIYNYWSLRAEVPQNKEFVSLCNRIHEKLKVQFPSINPETDERRVFFK